MAHVVSDLLEFTWLFEFSLKKRKFELSGLLDVTWRMQHNCLMQGYCSIIAQNPEASYVQEALS